MTKPALASRSDETLVCELDPFATSSETNSASSTPPFTPSPPVSSSSASSPSSNDGTPAYLGFTPASYGADPDAMVCRAPDPESPPLSSTSKSPLYLRRPALATRDEETGEFASSPYSALPTGDQSPQEATDRKVGGDPSAPADRPVDKSPSKATADGPDKAGKQDEAKDGASEKDGQPKSGKDAKPDQASDTPAKEAGGGQPAAKGKGAASPEAKAKAKAKAKKSSARTDPGEELSEFAPIAVVETERPSFGRAPVRQADQGESFRPAEPPAFRVRPKTGGKPEPPSPERERALALFREAMTLSAKLHASFLDVARQATANVQATENSLASLAQGDLDRSLDTLRLGLERARLALDSSADAADAFIEQRRRQTYGAITGAADSATGTLDALKKSADKTFEGHDGERTDKGKAADDARGGVTSAGDEAAEKVRGLDVSKETDHPTNVKPMPSAINEAINLRLPKRSKARAETYSEERGAQDTLLSTVFTQMKEALEKQFKAISKAMDETAKNSAASITKSRDAARNQLAKGARQMHGSVDQARERGHAALIEQHNTLRRQTIATHRDRALRENEQAQQRAARGAGTGLEAAKGQQAGASSLGEALAKEASRSPGELAKVITASAGGMLRQLRKSGPQQRDKLARGAGAGEDEARAQSQSLGLRLDGSAQEGAAQLEAASRSSGEALDVQVKTGTEPFGAIPGQVTAALNATLPTTTKAYDAQNEGTEAEPGAGQMILSAQKTIDDTLAGKGGGKAPPAAPAAGGGKAKGPKEKPAEFRDRAKGIAKKPNTDEGIAALVSTAKGDIPPRIENKVGPLYNALMATSTTVETVMAELRGLTAAQGRALSDVYNTQKSRDLAADLKSELNKFFSDDYTNQENIAAALNYLAGKTVEAANHELKAAVYLWNDTGRSEKVLRALTPEQLDKLKQDHGDTVADVSGDLDESEKKIFDALKEIKPTENLQGQALEDQRKANYALLGVANANALKRDIDQALETRGEEGGDKATDVVSTGYQSAGSDTLSGGDGAYEDPAAAEERRKAIWKETDTSFEKAASKLPDGSPNVAAGEGDKLGAIARYAAASRERTEFVPDDGPNGGHFETVKKGLDPKQARLIDDIAKTGPNSEDTAASTIEFETNRKEGKPREDRLRKALLGEDLMGAREGESDEKRAERLADKKNDKGEVVEKGDLQKTKDRKAAVLQKVAERRAEGQKTADGKPVEPMKAEDVQKQITGQLDARFAGDPTGAAYTKSMIESETLEPDPGKAFDFALAHDERNKETLKATTERMNRDQIKEKVAKWDEGKPESERLYARLGMYGHKGRLEGDARNETEISFRGKPRNDKEKALIAVMVVEQQRRDSAATGRALASGDYDRMTGQQAKVLGYLGIKREDIDETGDIKAKGPDGKPIKGKFDEKTGQLKLSDDERADFETAMRFSHMDAESYKQAVDRISQGIVMALIVAAAIITTFVTFGGAAAIWGPILITAAAGFAGMAMTAAIRGDRYTSAEMQRDFVMTLVSAATAGLGASLGAAAKGAGAAGKGAAALEKGAETAAKGAGTAGKGAAALEKGVETAGKATASGQKLASGAAGLAGKETLTLGGKALQFGKDVVIGGTTNSINSFAGAAMDPENRRQGKALDKGIQGGVKGFLSGSLGAAITKPISALGRPLGKAGERIAGNVGSGFATRLADARIGQAMGDPHQSWAESIEGAKEGIAQDAIQAFGEHHAEGAAERRAGRKAAAARTAAGAGEPHGGPVARPDGPQPEGPQTPKTNAPDEDGAARARAVQEAMPPDVRPVVDETAGRALPPPANDNEPFDAAPTRRRAGEPDEAARVRPIDEGGVPSMRPGELDPHLRPGGTDDDGPHLRSADGKDLPASERPTGKFPAVKRGLAELNADTDPRPLPIYDTADLTPQALRNSRSIPEDSRIKASNPHSEEAALANYHAMREADLHREVLLAKCVNPADERFGQYMVIQGGESSVRRPPDGWIAERHSHPLLFEIDTSQRLCRSLPSGEGADFGVLRREVDMMSGLVNSTKGIKRESVIDVRLGDQVHETHFSITRNGNTYEYHISFRPPHDGVDKLGPFYSLTDYETAAGSLTGQRFGKGVRESMNTADGTTVSAKPPRPVHGEALTPSMRQDLDFVAGRMALAGEFEGQLGGTRPRGEIDPALGRVASLSDAHQGVVRMGLVGEPDSLIRLHNILNDDNIPLATRAMISDVTLAATRNHLLNTGELAPGEPLVILFHGAGPERTQSLVKQGIDMARRPGGPDDDFGQGLYLTRSLETALKYRERRSGSAAGDPQGGVVPYMLRGRDLGNSVDVSTGGKLRAKWEAFAIANARTLVSGGGDALMFTPMVRDIMLGRPVAFNDFEPTLLRNRGTLFNDFLASIGAKPDVVFGDLGGPLTNGIQLQHMTDQMVVRTQGVADVMNQQHVRAGTSDANVSRGGTSGGGGDDGPTLRTAGGGEGSKEITLAPIERLDDQQLKNRVDNAFDAMAPGPQPRRPGDVPEGTSLRDPAVAAAEEARRGANVAQVVAEVSARRGPEAAARLTELLIVGGEPMARALRAETEEGMTRALGALPETLAKPLPLTPAQRTLLIDLMLARAAREAPNQPAHLREARIRKQVAGWEKNGLSSGDVQRFAGAATDLKGEGRQGFATPARLARNAEDFNLRPAVDAALAAQGGAIWGVQTLRDILAATKRGWLVRFAHEGMLARGDSVPPLIERWYAYLDSVKPPNKVSAQGFEKFARGHMQRVERAAFSELEAAFALGGRKPHLVFSTHPVLDQRLEILKCAIDPETGQNNPTVGGTDLIGYRRADDKIVVGDDKAWTRSDDNRGIVDEVKAYFPSKEQAKKNPRAGLIQNLADDAHAMNKIFGKQQAKGQAVDPRHLALPARLEAASKALEKAFPKGLVLSKATAPKVRKILRAHGIELIVTSMAGRDMTSVSDRLRKAGVAFRRGPIIFPEPEDEE